MKRKLWDRVEAVCEAALALPWPERATFVAQACVGNGELLEEVQSLLAGEERAVDAFLERPAILTPLGPDVHDPIGQDIGVYHVVERLGAGGMGVVFRAIDRRLKRPVALKLLPEGLTKDRVRLARFNQEAKFLASLSHPNVVRVYDLGEYRGAPYVVSELLDGHDLRTRLASGSLPQAEACAIAARIASGLAAAHEHGIVHRDIKPENVYLTKNEEVKILDFGLAKRVSVGPVESEIRRSALRRVAASSASARLSTIDGAVVGTVAYMSPEQIRGRRVDHRSDVFSLGLVLYEMLAGRRAFERASDLETMEAILAAEPLSLSEQRVDLSPFVVRLVSDCLRKEVGERYQSAHDLCLILTVLAEP